MPFGRRGAAALTAVAVLALAGCGDDDDGASTAAPLTAAATRAAATTSPGSTPATDASLPAASTAVRTVQGADGPVEIPVDPQRIVGDLMSLDYMSALGIDT